MRAAPRVSWREPIAAAPAPRPADDGARSAADRGLALFEAGSLGEAMPFLRAGAEAGDGRAQYILATALFNGDHVRRDVDAAVRWMRRARDAGLAQAQASLAEMERLRADSDSDGDRDGGRGGEPGRLMSPGAIDECRRLLAAVRPPAAAAPVDTLAAMTAALVAELLGERLDEIVSDAVKRAVGTLPGTAHD